MIRKILYSAFWLINVADCFKIFKYLFRMIQLVLLRAFIEHWLLPWMHYSLFLVIDHLIGGGEGWCRVWNTLLPLPPSWAIIPDRYIVHTRCTQKRVYNYYIFILLSFLFFFLLSWPYYTSPTQWSARL